MLKISVISLSGGQGKTTTTLFLSKLLASKGFNTLTIDADPQGNLTSWLEHDPQPGECGLLEVLKGISIFGKPVILEQGLHPVKASDRLILLPSTQALDSVQDFLSNSGMAAIKLREKLMDAEDDFDICLIDSPPQKSQLANAVIGAADMIIISIELNVKGFTSLVRTIDAIDTLFDGLRTVRIPKPTILGIMPFRDRWVGLNRTKGSEDILGYIKTFLEEQGLDPTDLILPPFRESAKVPAAILDGSDITQMDLGYPIQVLAEKIQAVAGRLEVANV